MKKSQLPEDIRIHCPEGLSDEQVEAWLLGYLASNSQSAGQGGKKPPSVWGGVDFSAQQPDETTPTAPTTEEPETYKELQAPQTDEAAPFPSQLSTDAPASWSFWGPRRENTTKLVGNVASKGEPEPGKDWVIITALVLGGLCVPLFEFGLLTYAGIIFSVWASVRSYQNFGRDKNKVVGATVLNVTFFFVSLMHYEHIPEEVGGFAIVIFVPMIGFFQHTYLSDREKER